MIIYSKSHPTKLKMLKESSNKQTKKRILNEIQAEITADNNILSVQNDFRSTNEYIKFRNKYYKNHPEMLEATNALTGQKRLKKMNSEFKKSQGLNN